MSQPRKLLTDAKCRTAVRRDAPYKLTDSHGLYLEVRPTGAKLWRYRYRIEGKENVYALGEYAAAPAGETPAQAGNRHAAGMFTLDEARHERSRCRALVRRDIHPKTERDQARANQSAENKNTFEAVANEWLAQFGGNWSDSYRDIVKMYLETDAYPRIGKLPLRSITAAQVLGVLRPVEKRGAESAAILLRQVCSAIFRYGVATSRADTDPASALRGVISRPKVKHRTPLAQDEIPAFLAALGKVEANEQTKIAIRLLLLTFVRPGELRATEWSEVNTDGALWRIPAQRMKMREAHIVPLSKQAVVLLRRLEKLTGKHRFLFPNRNPALPMGGSTINRVLERMGYTGRFSAHGFRATASTIMNECGFRPEVIERQLAHKERNQIRGSYNQAQYLQERQQMMQQWADMIDTFAKSDKKVIAGRFGKAA